MRMSGTGSDQVKVSETAQKRPGATWRGFRHLTDSGIELGKHAPEGQGRCARGARCRLMAVGQLRAGATRGAGAGKPRAAQIDVHISMSALTDFL